MQRIRPKLMLGYEAIAGKTAAAIPLRLSNWVYFTGAAIVSAIAFLLIYGILAADNSDENEGVWIWSSLGGAAVFGLTLAVRKSLLRRARHRLLLKQERLSFPQSKIYQESRNDTAKFTLEQNTIVLKAIQQKSDAANALGTSSDLHLEAFRICSEYLEHIEAALPTVHAGSPRLAAFRSGQTRVGALQKRHLLEWAATESKDLMREAQLRTTTKEKLENSQRALEILEPALTYLPDERQLIESAAALREFSSTIRVSHWIEQAERAAFKKQSLRAIDFYRDALFYLSRETMDEREREITASKIQSEIDKLREQAKLERDF